MAVDVRNQPETWNTDETVANIPIKTITQLMRVQQVLGEKPFEFSDIKTRQFPASELKENVKYWNQMGSLYANGFSGKDEFSGSGWKETSTFEEVERKLEAQFVNPELALTLVRVDDNVRGFFTSQVLQIKQALTRVSDSITAYGQDKMPHKEIGLYSESRDYILPKIRERILSVLHKYSSYTADSASDAGNNLPNKFEEILHSQGAFMSDGFDARIQPIMPVMEDLVIDPRVSTFRTIVEVIHANTGELLEKYFDKEHYTNPYAITWTNRENPIFQFLTSLGEPHFKIMELEREVPDDEEGTRTIKLVVFAVNLEDLHRITSNSDSAGKELLRRSLKNNPMAAIKQIGKKLGKRVSLFQELQMGLSGSILEGIINAYKLQLEP